MTEENEKNWMKKLCCKKEYTPVSMAGNYPRPPPRRKDRGGCLENPAWKSIAAICTVLSLLLFIIGILQQLGFLDMLYCASLDDHKYSDICK